MKTNIVIIDSGVRKDHPVLRNRKISTLAVCHQGNQYGILSEGNDELGHGTAVCGTICSSLEIEEDISVLSIKIYEGTEFVELDALLYALSYIEHKIDCDIVHISSGVLEYSRDLEEQCRRLVEKGICIVAAFDNNGAVSYPAAFAEVIGVDATRVCAKSNEWIYVESGIVNVLAKGGNHRLAWTTPDYIIAQGASFSAGYVTAAIARQLKRGLNIHDVKMFLKMNAIKIYNKTQTNTLKETVEMVLKMRQVGLFPYNKEMHSLVNFCDLLPFEIQGIYSSRYLGNIGERVRSLDGEHSYQIQNIDEIVWESIDTLVLGHIQEVSNAAQVDYKEIILNKCLEKRVNVYAFDDWGMEKYKDLFDQRGLHLFYPHIHTENMIKKAGKLYSISAPVLGVFGTSSVQGKFTLQLNMRKRLLEEGYNVAQLGTEPTALLFGMDAMYPFGYASAVYAKEEDAIEIINYYMHKLDVKNPDIIIAGSQSGTIPACFYNTSYLNIAQHMFLLGVNPDAVVLCVNVYDDFSYIKRTVAVIENVTICKVIAIAVSPLTFTDDLSLIRQRKQTASMDHIKNFVQQLSLEVRCPIYALDSEEGIDLILEKCLAFFEEEEQ